MILILSNRDDGNTQLVAEWLHYYNKPYVRLNGDDNKTNVVYIDVKNRELIVVQNNQQYNLYDATSLWFRRRGLSARSVRFNQQIFSQTVLPDAPEHHKKHLQSELDVLFDFIRSSLTPDTVLGSPVCYSLNKLKVLAVAEKHGISTPDSYVVSTREDAIKLIEKIGKGVITKALGDGVYKFTDNVAYYSYTERLTRQNVAALPETFVPSLVQAEIRKRYELRSFFMNGDFYTMAIFSQTDKQTTVDFRKYNHEKPNRTVPFALPERVQQQLRDVFKELELNTGSVDLIVDENGDYVFLEINPVGQIGMTSGPCNYQLEKRIAQIL